ncbi:MAG: SoxR reducing system RseC family protein [candidate division WOR-3 bacterium]
MEEIGKVIKTDKNKATVLIENPQSCDSCEFAKFCRIDKKGREITCRNHKGAKKGDIVQLHTSSKNFFIATALNFILPLLILIAGVILGKKIFKTDLAGFAAGMGITTIYFIVFLFIDKKTLKKGTLLPEIEKIIKKRK